MTQASGEMVMRIREFDWRSTSIGPYLGWPLSWRHAAQLILDSGFPAALALGPELVYLYNDAFIPLGGPARHPSALGRPVKTVWQEIWPYLEARFKETLSTGRPTVETDLLMPLMRSGFLEETYMRFSFAVVRDDQGAPSGILCTATENTELVITRRQTECLRRMATQSSDAESPEEACRLAAAVLEEQRYDVPFALLYLFDRRSDRVRLVASAGLDSVPEVLPRNVRPEAGGDPWGLAAAERGEPSLIENVAVLGPALRRPHPVPHRAIALPIAGSPGSPCGILLAGLNPMRPAQESRQFYEFVATHLEKAICSAHMRQLAVDKARDLAALDHAKTAYFSTVSHELRSPIASLLSWLEVLQNGKVTRSQMLGSLEVLELATNSLRRLSEDLYDVARATSRPMDVTPRRFESIAPLIASVVEAFGPEASQKSITLSRTLETDSGPARVDPDRLRQVVSNLLSNAIRFTPPGGHIEVSCARRCGSVELRVTDSGRGIRADALPHVFEKYWQGRPAPDEGGLGLGLAISRRLVELHGGKIEALSEGEGLGATFVIRLPLVTERPSHRTRQSVEAPSRLRDAALSTAVLMERQAAQDATAAAATRAQGS